MNTRIDREYLQRRHRESLAQAEAAGDPGIARVHREFAEHYATKLGDRPGTAIDEDAAQA